MNDRPAESSGCYLLSPGGAALTRQLLIQSGLPKGSVIVDVGCGFGDSVCLLQSLGCEAYGIDIDEARLETARRQAPALSDHFFCRDAAELLDPQGEFFLAVSGLTASGEIPPDIQASDVATSGIRQPDAFLFECSFTKLKNPELTVRQAFSSLKPGGFVLLGDVVTEAGNGCLAETLGTGAAAPDAACLLGRLIPADEIISCFTDAGFSLTYRQDHPELLRAYTGNLILNLGAEEAERCLGMSLRQLKTASLNYETMLFRK